MNEAVEMQQELTFGKVKIFSRVESNHAPELNVRDCHRAWEM
jgi:hypothetical protein